jgi:broad specificity phosphatase PhoE
MSGNEITQRFPWTSLNAKSHPLITPEITARPFAPVQPSDEAWWTYCFESRKRSEKRVEAVGKWITTALREQSGDDNVIVFVCHGGAISELTNLLMNYALTSTVGQDHKIDVNGIRNTSVTSLIVPGAHSKYIGERPTSSGQVNKHRVKLEQLNDAAHLGDEQLRFWASYALGANAKSNL